MTDERLDEIKTKWNISVTLPMAVPWGKDDVVWLVGEVTRLRAEAQRALRDVREARKQLDALRWQVEHEGCAASHLGETTYECRADAPCGLCRLRAERDRLRAAREECDALGIQLVAAQERLRLTSVCVGVLRGVLIGGGFTEHMRTVAREALAALDAVPGDTKEST